MEKQSFIFERSNYVLMLAGIVLIVIGFILMAGGGSDDPSVFNPEIFAPRRIVVAPIIIMAGLLLEIFAIMKRGSSSNG